MEGGILEFKVCILALVSLQLHAFTCSALVEGFPLLGAPYSKEMAVFSPFNTYDMGMVLLGTGRMEGKGGGA